MTPFFIEVIKDEKQEEDIIKNEEEMSLTMDMVHKSYSDLNFSFINKAQEKIFNEYPSSCRFIEKIREQIEVDKRAEVLRKE